MPQISATYASPGLRLGLLQEDFPSVTTSFRLASGEELGIPKEFGGDGNFCVATIHFGNGRPDAVAWKPVPKKGDADQWNVLCTKTLGRALKKAGYPDDTDDLKALVLWRRRNAEIGAIQGGLVTQAVSPGPVAAIGTGTSSADTELDAAFDQAATSSPDGRSGGDDSIVTDATVVVTADEVAEVRELVLGLNDEEMENYKGFLRTISAPDDPGAMSAEQIFDVLAWLNPGD